jgi:DNA excision repair protein ERCC-4
MLIIGPKTKQLLKDVSVLRHLLEYLLSYDCASFNLFLETILASNASNAKSVFSDSVASPWLMLDDAQIVFECSRKRVYTSSDGVVEPHLEEQPKWKAFVSVLEEINSQRQKTNESGKVLVMVKNVRTQRQLQRIFSKMNESSRQFSNIGVEQILGNSFKRFMNWKKLSKPTFSGDEKQPSNPTSKRRRMRGGLASSAGRSQIDTSVDTQDYSNPKHLEELHTDLMDEPEQLLENDSNVTIEVYEDLDLTSASLLTNLMPKFIVIYDPEVSFVRQIEIFKSLFSEHPIQVYFLVYDNSVEEQKYLSLIRREKESFEKLIYQNSVIIS